MPAKGYKLSEEAKEKIRQSKLGDKNPAKRPEVRLKMSETKKERYKLGLIIPPRGMLGKKMSKETREKMSKSRMGKPATIGMTGKKHRLETRIKMSRIAIANREKHPNWKGGNRRTLDKMIRQSLEYRLWREAVFERDNYTCRFCGIRGGYLEADHIKPFILFPELRFAIDNGRTLCRECHKKTETYGNKIRKFRNV